MKHSISAAILILVGMGTLAACSSSSAPAHSASSAGTSVAASAAASTSASGASSDAGASTPPASVSTSSPAEISTITTGSGTTDCLEGQLLATIDPRLVPGNGTLDANGATKKGIIVDFKNTSTTTCTLIGYPGAATVDAAGTQVTQATRTLRGALDGLPAGSDTIPTVSLAPGHYADAMIEGVDHQQTGAAQAGCAENLPSILVTPPNTKIAVRFNEAWPACYSFDVHPVMALTVAP